MEVGRSAIEKKKLRLIVYFFLMKEHLNSRFILNIVCMNTGSCWKHARQTQEQSATSYFRSVVVAGKKCLVGVTQLSFHF
jgi:hypothetical protein